MLKRKKKDENKVIIAGLEVYGTYQGLSFLGGLSGHSWPDNAFEIVNGD